MRKALVGLALTAIGAVGLVGCEDSGEEVLDEVTIDGPVIVRVVEEHVFGDYNNFRMDVLNASGEVQAQCYGNRTSSPTGRPRLQFLINHPDSGFTYNFRRRAYFRSEDVE